MNVPLENYMECWNCECADCHIETSALQPVDDDDENEWYAHYGDRVICNHCGHMVGRVDIDEGNAAYIVPVFKDQPGGE